MNPLAHLQHTETGSIIAAVVLTFAAALILNGIRDAAARKRTKGKKGG